METFAASYALLWLLVAFQGFIAVVLVHRLAELRRLAPIPPAASARILAGDAVPDFSAVDLRLKTSLSGSQLKGTCKALLFLAPDCGVCRRLAADLARTPGSLLNALVVIFTGTEEESERWVKTLPVSLRVLRDDQGDVTGAFGLSNFPTAVWISGQWTVTTYSHPSESAEVLEYLQDPRTIEPVFSGTVG